MEAKLPAAWTSHGRPPTSHLPTGPKERPPPVIVAKLNQRRASPTSSREPMPRIEAAAIIQMRRLQEGSDADGATVACPKWTGFSPLDDMLEGKHDAPSREAAPNDIVVAKAFAQKPSSTNAGSRSRTPCQPTPPSSLSRRPTEAPSEGHRRAGCTQQPHSYVGRHPLRPGHA